MSGIEVSGILVAYFRALGLLTIIPLGWDLVGIGQRLVISLALAIFLAPLVVLTADPHWTQFVFELGIGIIIGLPGAVVVECAGMAGELVDTARGQTIAQAYDPLQQSSIPLLAIVAKQACWCAVILGGYLLCAVHGLAQSFSIVHGGAFEIQALSGVSQELILYLVKALNISILAALPFAAIALGVEMALGLFCKSLALSSVSSETFLVKTILSSILIILLLEGGPGKFLFEASRPILSLLVVG